MKNEPVIFVLILLALIVAAFASGVLLGQRGPSAEQVRCEERGGAYVFYSSPLCLRKLEEK
jgi:hypothetical protein